MSTDAQGLDALYTAPLSGFLDARKALASALKKAGDKEGAAKVAALAKPTPAAWAVNQVARRNATDMAALIELGGEIRSTMRAGLAGDSSARARLAALEGEQQELIAMLLTLAKAQLDADGATSSQVVLDRVKTTLTTISTTGKWGDAEPGRLDKELGIPSVETLAALLLDDSKTEPKASPRPARAPAAAAPKPTTDAKAEAAAAAEKKRAHDAAVKAARDEVAQAKRASADADAAAKAARSDHAAAKAALERETGAEQEARDLVTTLEAKLADAREAARAAASAVRNAKSALGARDEALANAARTEAAAARALVEAERKLAAITSKS